MYPALARARAIEITPTALHINALNNNESLNLLLTSSSSINHRTKVLHQPGKNCAVPGGPIIGDDL
jgi:hypothetical protein